ncbi:RluA family pseudouridine synthase [Terribacillus sp. DMT04]|uniref:RluA family pseudouridine synthase n=1 Tax=Terribacillus sp. DMT04 TaxID=2850441 RepID=UPI001C2C08CB|nr:RluA family pseudouridine synthase [Terribacillus sp. DMT04]QXE02453.1 RluA family pseudouridine synthase [Terribacillus sp. DMT04]
MKNKRPRTRGFQPAKPKEYNVTEAEELLPFLIKVVNKSRNSVKSILSRGQVAIDGRVSTQFNDKLQPGQKVTIRTDMVTEAPPMSGITILHEDDAIIVIEKASGLLSIASDNEKSNTAYRQLSDYVKAQHSDNKIFVVHRLDRDTSGVMVFARSEEIKQKMQQEWTTTKERAYVALVEGSVSKPEGTITSWLKETSTHKMFSSKYENDGQKAITHYKVVQGNNNFTLMELSLDTGRKNQIRVHMHDIGHPIAGDRKYGAGDRSIKRLCLHARKLNFSHPVTGLALRFVTDIPNLFKSKSR